MTVIQADSAARRMIREALDDTLVVEAAAGTGKTTELITRTLQVIARGRADIREIVAVTFTEKAAGELKLRLRQGLELERANATDMAAARRLDDAVQNLEEAHVSTIHGFCADLLRERPIEARIDPLFRVLTEGQAERLFTEAFTAWFQRRLADPPEGTRRSLRRASRSFRPGDADEDAPMERLRRAAWDLAQWRDFRAPWTREPFDRAGDAARLVELVHRVAELSHSPSYINDNLFLDTAPVRRLSEHLRTMRAAGGLPSSSLVLEASTRAGVENSERLPRESDPETTKHKRVPGVDDLDALESQLVELRRNRDFKRARKGSGPGYRKGVPRAEVLAARDELMAALDLFQQRADAELAALLQAELLTCVDEYEALKAREGALDFLDLLLKARNLVRDNAPVRRHFQSRFKRIFVDEFQDTDPLQAELLLLLASSDPAETEWRRVIPAAGKLFVVGDPKQSIYRFRRADVGIYSEVCDLLRAAGAVHVALRRSFRAVPNIQRAVNAAFEPIMGSSPGDPEARRSGVPGDRAHARYTPLEPDRPDHPQPSVVALPVPEPYAQKFIAAREIERSLPDAAGAFVEWLVNHSGWTVTERRQPGKRVRLEARHICILFRRFVSYGEDITRPYVRALEARGLRHLLIGGKAFHDREEIETLRAALMAIEWPDDELSVFATLRGPLFAIGDEDLFEYHHLWSQQRGRREGRFHPYQIAANLPSGLGHIRDALTLLAALHKERNRVPVADTISRLLEETRAHVGFVLRPGGEQALANVLHVSELARQYELEGGMSFRGFVDVLQEAASSGQAPEAPILEEGTDGVRLMTVHKAKGLEFPVVILADMTARLTPYEIGRYVDADGNRCALRVGGWLPKDLTDHREEELLREREEAERIAYVAATRARDLLVVPVVGDEPYTEGWVSPLNGALYPSDTTRRTHTAAPGCPSFTSRDSVLRRPDGDPASPRTVCPGLHTFGMADDGSAYSVVWWSPFDLTLGIQAPFGLRRDDLIVKDVAPSVLMRYKTEYESWRAARASRIERAGKPSILVRTATETADAHPDALLPVANIEVAVDTVAGEANRPRGARFGALVHALLSDIPLAADSDTPLTELADVHGRVLGATGDEIAAAREVVANLMAHPVMQAAARAASAERCYRETPVTLRLDDGSIVEGHVDLAFEQGDEFVVVDFKTDRELDGAVERYRRQVQIYAAAIAEATGKPARGVLMKI
jgi:ATP-dependent helicase/nuclease subunit A